MKKKTVCIALAVLAVALIAVALVLLLRKPGKTEPTATAPSENVPVTLPGQEELSITTAGDNAQPTDAQGVRPTAPAAGESVTGGKITAGTAGPAAATPTENGATTKKGATTGATTSGKEPAKTTTERTVSNNLKTEDDSSAGKFGELF